MQKSKYFIVLVLMLGVYLLSACSGGTPAPAVVGNSQNGQSQEVVFTGSVESMGGGQWQISGQQISVDATTLADANIQVGDIVRVQAVVSQDGSVVAVKIESSGGDNGNANSNSNDANTNDNTNTGNDNSNANGNDNSNANDNGAPAGQEQEAFGVVEAITTDSITINGVVYSLANFTEFKNVVIVGDQVKIHVIVNADGTFTIVEIEKSAGVGIGDDNSNDDNSNSNGNDDNSNDNSNDDNSNDNSNDDNSNSGGDDNNSNGDDDDSNSNSNDND